MSKGQTPKRRRRTYPKPDNFVPELTFPKGHKKAGLPRCLAWNVNHGRQCLLSPVRGKGHPASPDTHKTVCRRDGGATPGGVDSPHFKTGRWSKYLPDRLIDAYFKMANDPGLVNLRDDIDLVDAFIADALVALRDTDKVADWGMAKKIYEQQIQAIMDGDIRLNKTRAKNLMKIFSAGIEQDKIIRRYTMLVNQKRKLAETQRRLYGDLHIYITAERAIAMITAVAALVKEVVSDKDERRRIAEGLRRISSSSTGRPDRPAG